MSHVMRNLKQARGANQFAASDLTNNLTYT